MQANGLCPKVSVVMPCYNNAPYLRQAIDSVLQQDYPNIELIVVDDGSTDHSLDVLTSYGDRIRLIVQPNQGPAAARNNGIRHATGTYIAFLDSDDLWLPGKLSAQLTFLQQNPDFIACYCSWSVWDGQSPVPESTASEQGLLQENHSGWLYLLLLKTSVITTISVVIRAETVAEAGFFNEAFKVGEDHDYWLRLSRLGKIAKLRQVYALYRQNPQSTTNKVHPKNFSLLVLQAAVEKYGLCNPDGQCLSEDLYHQYLAERHFVYGYQSFWTGYKDNAVSAFLGCLTHQHYRLKSIIYLAICHISPLYQYLVRRRSR